MTKNLKKNIHLLLLLGDKSTPKDQALNILLSLRDDQVHSLTEVIYNFLHRNVPVDSDTLKFAKKENEFLRKIGDKDISLPIRKRTLKKSSKRQRESILKILHSAAKVIIKL